MQLYAHEGITPGIRRAFAAYLACVKRPIHELLFPQLRDLRHDYAHNFRRMTAEPALLAALLATRDRPVQQVQRELEDDERRFLLPHARCEPECGLLGIAHLERLPGICGRLHNSTQLQKTNARKFTEPSDALAARFAGIAIDRRPADQPVLCV